MARNLVVMHFIRLQFSIVSGKNDDDVITSKIKKITTKRYMLTHYSNIKK